MFEKASAIIRDGSRLDYSYVPDRLVHRESQMSSLERLFRPLAESNRSCTAALHGSVGTGKTVTAALFCRELSEYMAKAGRPVDVISVNCRNTSESGVLLRLIRHFDRGFPDRGFSPDDMARVLSGHLAESARGTVVVLDEVDVLLKKTSVDLVYQLTRPDAARRSPVSLILISQDPLDRLLDQASMSSFRRTNVVRFDRYSRSELREIVGLRAEEALYPGRITPDALDLIAEHASEYGDARMAIELLDRAANIAEEDSGGEVGIEHVRAAKAMIYSTVTEERLRGLDVHRQAALLAIARSMKDNPSIPIAVAEKTYAVVCEEYGMPARKHTQFWTYIQDLARTGVIKLTSAVDSGGKASQISLPDIPSRVLAEKMEDIMDGGAGGDGDEVRSLRPRGRDIRQVQRVPSLRPALHALC